MALADGVALASSLLSGATLAQAAEHFDADSNPRCKQSVKKSHIVIALTHSTGWRYWLTVWLLRILNFVFLR